MAKSEFGPRSIQLQTLPFYQPTTHRNQGMLAAQGLASQAVSNLCIISFSEQKCMIVTRFILIVLQIGYVSVKRSL